MYRTLLNYDDLLHLALEESYKQESCPHTGVYDLGNGEEQCMDCLIKWGKPNATY